MLSTSNSRFACSPYYLWRYLCQRLQAVPIESVRISERRCKVNLISAKQVSQKQLTYLFWGKSVVAGLTGSPKGAEASVLTVGDDVSMWLLVGLVDNAFSVGILVGLGVSTSPVGDNVG